MRAAGRAGRGLEPAPRDDQAPLEGVVGERARVVRRHATAEPRSPGRTPGRDAAADAPSAATSTGTARQASDRQAGLGEGRLDERPGTRLGGAAARQEQRDDRRPLGGRASPASSSQDEPVERERDPGAVARFAVGPERAAMAQRGQAGQGQRQDPVARSPARVRDEPDAARVVLEARLVQRGDGAAVAGSVAVVVPWPVSGEGDGPAAVDDGSTAAGPDVLRRARPGGGPPGHT